MTIIDMDFVADANDNIYLTGYTWSTEFPVEKPYTGTLAGTTSAFVSVFAPHLPIDLIYDKVVIACNPYLQHQGNRLHNRYYRSF